MLVPYNLAQIQFSLGENIGREGKNSSVFKAHDPQLNADIVIKQIAKNKLANQEEYFHESQMLYSGSHSNVVPVYYACQNDSYIYLAMPYYAKGSLKSKIANSPLSLREVIVLGTQFLSGLHHIHSKHLIHFDVKPDNVLISDRGEAVLSDFGLAKQMTYAGVADQDRSYGKMIPPEAFSSDTHSKQFDIYQVGLTLYRMCVGDLEFYKQYNGFGIGTNFDRDTFKFNVTMGRFPDRSAFPAHIPAKMKKVILKCLETDPSNRFGSVSDIVSKLAEVAGNCLDWNYSIKANCRTWHKDFEGKICNLTVSPTGEATATKKVGDGDVRRISDYCVTKITEQKIQSFLTQY